MNRDRMGKFTDGSAIRFFRRLVKWAFVFIVIGAGLVAVLSKNNETIVYVDRPVMLDNLANKINELKGELLSDLRNCESRGYTEDDGLLIFDSNAKASIGSYQFQKSTVQHYYKTLYGRELTGKEAILIALDDEKAGELASDIIFKQGKLSDWVNCTRKEGLAQKLEVINKLSK
jgi:hypothetical protein